MLEETPANGATPSGGGKGIPTFPEELVGMAQKFMKGEELRSVVVNFPSQVEMPESVWEEIQEASKRMGHSPNIFMIKAACILARIQRAFEEGLLDWNIIKLIDSAVAKLPKKK